MTATAEITLKRNKDGRLNKRAQAALLNSLAAERQELLHFLVGVTDLQAVELIEDKILIVDSKITRAERNHSVIANYDESRGIQY